MTTSHKGVSQGDSGFALTGTFYLHLKLNSTWNDKPNSRRLAISCSNSKLLRKLTSKRKYLWIVCGFLKEWSVKFSFWTCSLCVLIVITVTTFQQKLMENATHSRIFRVNVRVVMSWSNSPQEFYVHETFSKCCRLICEISLLISLFYRPRKTTAFLRLTHSLIFQFIIKSNCHVSPLC